MTPLRSLPLLLEVGCEEIPARFLTQAQEDLGRQLHEALAVARLLPQVTGNEGTWSSQVFTYSTPRRLVAWVPKLLAQQPDQVEEVLGPPVKAAFDAQGRPTRAAESFAAKHGAQVGRLSRVTTPRGEYVALRKQVPGQSAVGILPTLLRDAVVALSFPKSMYWASKSTRFVRPVRWLLALLGEGKTAQVVPFEFASVRSGRTTYGHRAVRRTVIQVSGFTDYARKLRLAGVEFDPTKRSQSIREQVKVVLEDHGLNLVEDKALEEWVVNSTECPCALLGSFEERFLKLPREILTTVMREHQKYFAVEDRDRNLRPWFVTILNHRGDRRGLIRAGHERVLTARFTDAEFFWNVDQRLPLESRRELLAGVTYQAELGSYTDKVRRMTAIAQELATQPKAQGNFGHRDLEHLLRAVELSKCDLTTQMVKEFPELQGIVGGLYAGASGEPPEVCEAIYDHYRPQGIEDRCPRSHVGAILSLADKIDTVTAGFAIGQEPTGSSDPFALRRQGNAIIKVLLEVPLRFCLRPATERALNALSIEWRVPREQVFASVGTFLIDRLSYYLETVRRFRYDTVRAVLAAGWDPPYDALRRAEALEAMRGSQDLEALSLGAKRIKNILAKSVKASDWEPGEVDTALLQEEPEAKLYAAFIRERQRTDELRQKGDYQSALEAIARLRTPVDGFFDRVLVLAEDRAVRENRLRLLGKLDELFSSVAHFAEIAAPAHVDASTSAKRR